MLHTRERKCSQIFSLAPKKMEETNYSNEGRIPLELESKPSSKLAGNGVTGTTRVYNGGIVDKEAKGSFLCSHHRVSETFSTVERILIKLDV